MAGSTSSVPSHARAGTSAPPAPAYASAPRRSGLLYALAAIVALAALCAMALFVFGGRSSPMPSMGAGADPHADEARKALESAKAALEEASKNVLQPAGSPTPQAETTVPPSTAPGAPSAAVADGKPAPDAAPAVPAPPAPQVAASQDAPRAAPRTEPPKSAPRPAAKAPPPASAPTPAAAPVVVAAAPAPPARAAPDERWVQMRQEIDRCPSPSLVSRMQCERRILTRYCDGYWGSVPACPIGRQDHGN